MSTSNPTSTGTFRYNGFALDSGGTTLECHYSLDGRSFTERFELSAPPEAGANSSSTAALTRAARLVHLVAGVSYYKTRAPMVVELGGIGATEVEGDFLRHFYLEGLAEFAYRNGLDLGGVRFEGAHAARPPGPDPDQGGQTPGAEGEAGALIPFGGGIDSIVTVEEVRQHLPHSALVVVEPGGRRFEAIEGPAALTGLPVVRVTRHLDPQVLNARSLGFLNGHVPVTGILSAVALWAAVASGHQMVVMSNEWSASLANLVTERGAVNHQYSKSLDFEDRFRRLVAADLGEGPAYFSYLRARSELWVAQRFSRLAQYHPVFRSCNRAFHIDPDARLTRWCGVCDKCCFIDLVLAPFLDARQLAQIFDGREPLENPELLERFRTLLGISEAPKPFECVGEPGECRAAAVLAADRSDRSRCHMLAQLAAEARQRQEAAPEIFLQPMGIDHVPGELAPQDLLV